jgi:hypothetical protein
MPHSANEKFKLGHYPFLAAGSGDEILMKPLRTAALIVLAFLLGGAALGAFLGHVAAQEWRDNR